MRTKTRVAAAASLILAGALAADASLLLETFVRYRAVPPQQAGGRHRAAGRAERYQTGDTVRVSVSDRDAPFDLVAGSLRIRSASAGYDSGVQALVPEQDGRSLYFQWRTAALLPAEDYHIEVSVQRKDGAVSTRQMDVALHPVIVEDTILEQGTDLSLPYWSLGLQLTRRFRYDSGYGIYKGPLGYGWIHSYGMLLTEDTDGSVTLFDTSSGRAGYFVPSAPGVYTSAPGDDSRLTRNPDGVFYLRTPNGNLWRFRNDLKPDFLQDARGKRIDFTYDRNGRLGAATDGSGQRIAFTYDTEGRIVVAADSTGRSTAYTYDAQGNLEQFRDVGGALTHYSYDNRHRMTKIVFSDGSTRSFSYDAYGRLSRIAGDGGAGNTSFAYNLANAANGERAVTDAVGRTVRQLSIGDGFLTQTDDALGNRIAREYDGSFHLIRVVDAKRYAWSFSSDLGTGTREATDPLGNKTTIVLSPEDRQLTAVKDGDGHETHFSYFNGELELVAFADAGTSRRRLTQDAQGHIVEERIRRNGQVNRYVYDNRGLLLSKSLYDGSTATYAYDPRGNLVTAANAAGVIAMEYDVRDRLTKVTSPGLQQVQYRYDDRARVTEMVMPDGERVRYAFDSAGRLLQIARAEQVVASYEYDLANQPIRRALGNGVTTDLAYDAVGRLTQLLHRRGGAVLSSWSYTLDENGNRTAKSASEGAETYVYDKAWRLTGVTYADATAEAFEYDAAGNRTATTAGGVRSAVSSNLLNQITAAGQDTLTYDMNGNLAAWTTAAGTTRYAWDPEDRLMSVQLPGGATTAYSYDALGRLRSRTDANGPRYFVWDRAQIIVEQDAALNAVRSFTWGASTDELLDIRENGLQFFALHDALGSVTELTDATGAVVERDRYRAFGEPAAIGAHSPFLFTGALYDRAAGLLYLRNRWYSPVLGRFIQMDPIGAAGGINVYAYALNDPVNNVDRAGLCGGQATGGGSSGGWGGGRGFSAAQLSELAKDFSFYGNDRFPIFGDNQPWWNLPPW